MDQLEDSTAGFRTTHWTLVEALLRGDDPGRARDALCRAYWPPVYAYLRRSGLTRDAAAESTQAFFADVAIGRDLFSRVETRSGSLRVVLLAALKRFLVDRHRRSAARGAERLAGLGQAEVEEGILSELEGLPPDAAMERRWAIGVLHEALARCRGHFEATGRDRHWAVFAQRVIQPAIALAAPPSLAAVALEHGFASPAAAAAAIQVVKKRLVALIQEVAAEHASRPEEAETVFRDVVHFVHAA
jgi:RNA polymerase sigma-70 factor (ECF subfamily)